VKHDKQLRPGWKAIELYKVFFYDNKGRLILLSLLGVFSALTSVFMNYTLEYCVNIVFKVSGYSFTTGVVLFIVMAVSTFASDQLGDNYYITKTKFLFSKKIKMRLFTAYYKNPYRLALKRPTGARMNTDENVAGASEILATLFYSLPYAVLETIGFIAFLFIFVSWKMNVVLLALIPFAVVLKNLSQIIAENNGKIRHKKEASNSLLMDIFEKYIFCKVNNFIDPLRRRYSAVNSSKLRAQNKYSAYNSLLAFFHFLTEHAVKIIVPVYGTYLYTRGDISPGGVAICTMIFSGFLVPSLFQIGDIYNEIKGALPIITDISENLKIIKQDTTAAAVQNMDADVLLEAKGLSFLYAGEKESVLRKVSLVLPAKGFIAITGVSGSGKSTLSKLLINLYGPSEGTVTYNKTYFRGIDGIPDCVSIMTSNDYCIQDTVYHNIFFAATEGIGIELSGIIDILDRDGVHCDTMLGEDGKNLSGGQRQLVLLLRALAKKESRLVILDEPTSSLDSRTKETVLETIKAVSGTKCVVVISHDTDTGSYADVVYCLKNGELGEAR
jgi:ABC-type bacteriocin/lantibiotic exporter with double-glycine peptidase domain